MLQSIHPVNLYASARHALYQYGLRSKIQLNVPVLSLGNIVFGGSGKTPMVLWFLERYSSQFRIAVISQSYAAKLKTPQQVLLSESPHLFGDEAFLIKKKFPQVDVWSGPNKSQTAVAAVNANPSDQYDFLLVDDGYSHHRLARNLDIVLLDVSRPSGHFRFPPFGQLRESCDSLFRADLIVFTKASSRSESLMQHFKELLFDWKGVWGLADYQTKMRTQKSSSASKYLLYSGVGHFEHVLESAEKCLNQKIVHKIKFPNHFEYSKMDQENILQQLKKSGCRGLTTEKDLVKIQNQNLLNLTDVLDVSVQIDELTTRWIDEKIRSLL